MTKTKHKLTIKTVLVRPLFLILLCFALLILPTVAFAEGAETSVAGDSAIQDQSSGIGETFTAESFDSPAILDQDPLFDPESPETVFSAETSVNEDEPFAYVTPTCDLDEEQDPAEQNDFESYSSSDPDPVAQPATSGATGTPLYFQVEQVSMSPLLHPGAIVELISTEYGDGDLVVGQLADGTYVIKMLEGDKLVPLGAGVSYSAAEITILGAAALSSLVTEDLEAGGFAWSSVLAEAAAEPDIGDGSADNPYQIATWQNLYWITVPDSNGIPLRTARWAAHYLQMADIEFPSNINTWDEGKGWSPIGNSTTNFTGSYDGKGHTISGLFINRHSDSMIGLFGNTGSSAVLQNIGLVAVNVTGYNHVGGLVGFNGGTITDSHAQGFVTGGNGRDVGGLVGLNLGTITGSYAKVSVTGASFIGGLVGYNYSVGIISNSYAEGAVTGTLTYVGGLVGANSGEVSSSHAKGAFEITGYGLVGGLVGQSDGTITDSFATVSVKGVTTIGGLVGWNNTGKISNSFAKASVTGVSAVGGLVGQNNNEITGSYSEGTVIGTGNSVGGLVGSNAFNGTINNSFATGNVTGNDRVGGLVGLNYSTPTYGIVRITNSYATGNVTGNDKVGGLVGHNGGTGTIDSSYATGKVMGASSIGGLVGANTNTVTNSYWDKQTSELVISAGGEGKTTSDMRQLDTFVGWNISARGGEDTIWRIYEGSTYPLLRHFFAGTATITVSADSKTYDGTINLTGGSYQLEDEKNAGWVHAGTVSYQADSKNAGSREIVLLGVYSNQDEYDLVFTGSATISPRPITVAAVTDTKIYDGTTDSSIAPTITIGALASGDSVTWTQTFDSKHVGNGKTLTPAGAVNDGNSGNNYCVTFVNASTGVITVLPITVTAVTGTKVYDGTTDSGEVPTITSGLLAPGDSVTWTQTYNTKDVGTGLNLTPAGTINDGNGGNNYAVTFESVSAGAITVKEITITPNAGQRKIIGTADPVFTYRHTALIGDDQITGALGRVEGEDIGNYAYTLGDLSAGDNYNLLMTAEPATFAIVNRPVGLDSGDQGLLFIIPLVLTNISGQAANAVITPGFVTGGSPADLARAFSVYNQAMQHFDANRGSMSAAEKAVAEVELAVAYAAIKALELRLALQSGQIFDAAALVSAYQAAQAVLNSNRGLLTADQVAAAQALFDAIASVIGSIST